MKKKIIALCLVVALAATAVIGGTLAYFTDTDAAKNTFTVGNVKINLLESTLHRENAGYSNGQTPGKADNAELWSDVEKLGSNNDSPYKAGDTFYTDEQIRADAANYQTNLAAHNKLNPGESYHKMPYVENVGKNPAYIRIRVMFPAALDTAILNSSMYTTTALNNKEFTMSYDHSGTVDRGGVKYNVYTFTRIDPLEPGKMTYWNVWGTVHMDTDVTNAEIAELIPNGEFDVLVEADAIQADNFADATAAWEAFDKPAA